MTTLYDIGDEIKITLEGKIIEYSVSEKGDYYVIDIGDPDQKGNRIYLSSEKLKRNSFKPVMDDPLPIEKEREQ